MPAHSPSPQNQDATSPETTDRVTRTRETLTRLFGQDISQEQSSDPEFMAIMQRQIFGEIFYTGSLSDTDRELITITVLGAQQSLPQIPPHVQAALRVGTAPIAIREAVYQLAGFIGYPKTLNAIASMNEGFAAAGISLPLENTATVTEETRLQEGAAIQEPIYGTEIKDFLAPLPAEFASAIPQHLTAALFGEFYTRKGLTIAQRELLILCTLASLGGTDNQLIPHFKGNLKVGNSEETIIGALVHASPYMGFPRLSNALRVWLSLPTTH